MSYNTLSLILITTDHHLEDHRRHLKTLTAIIPCRPTQLMYSIGMCEAEGRDCYYMVTDYLVRKADLLKVKK